MALIAQLQSAVSMRPQIVSFGGCNEEFLTALDQDPNRQGEFSILSFLNVLTSKRWNVAQVMKTYPA